MKSSIQAPASLSPGKQARIDTFVELLREYMYTVAACKAKPTVCLNQFYVTLRKEPCDVFEAVIENNPAEALNQLYDLLAKLGIDVVEMTENQADFTASAFCNQPIPHYM